MPRRQRGLYRWITRRQGYLFFPALLLEGLNLHILGFKRVFSREKMEKRWLEISMIVLRLGAYCTVIFLSCRSALGFAFIGVQLAVFGLYMGSTFAPNHKGMPLLPRDSKVDFLRRQVLTSRNIKGNWVMDTFMGGLNYQIEHHLFPNMATAAPAQGAGDRQGILRHPQHPVHRDDADRVVRHRHPVPQPGRPGSGRGPLRVPDGRPVRSLSSSAGQSR